MTWPVVRSSKSFLGVYQANHGEIKALREVSVRYCVGSRMIQERLLGTDGL